MTPEARQRRRIRTPVLAVSAMAWAATLAVSALPSGSGQDMAGMPGMADGHGMAGMAGMAGMGTAADSSASTGWRLADIGSAVVLLIGWPLMLIAMMAPLLIPALRHVYARSLPARRRRSMTLLSLAYAAAWTAGGLILYAVTICLHSTARIGAAIVLGVAMAVVWQLSPAKQRCLNRRCAHPSIAAFGRRADLDALRFGGRHALWCFGSCWPLMLLPLLSGSWQLAAMVLAALWMWAESFDKPAAPSWRVRLPVKAVRILAVASRSVRQPA